MALGNGCFHNEALLYLFYRQMAQFETTKGVALAVHDGQIFSQLNFKGEKLQKVSYDSSKFIGMQDSIG